MNNITQVKELLHKHFCKSPEGIITVGILSATENKIIHFNKAGISETGNKQYGIGSISKTFIASYLSQLIQEGNIQLDDTVDTYFDVPSNRTYPTILELATHTSGYSKFVPFFQMFTTLGTTGFSKRNFYRNLDTDWLDKRIKSLRVGKKQYLYSDLNYAIIGRIFEKIKGASLNDLMNSYFKSMGLVNTKYIDPDTVDKKSWKWNRNNPFLASGGIYTTVEDMIQYSKYQIEDANNYLDTAYLKYFPEKNPKIYTSFSWNSFKNSSYYWHHGAMGYYRSSLVIDKKRGIAVVVLATIRGRRIQRMGYLSSSIYRNIKRNEKKFTQFVKELEEETNR